MAIRRSVIYYLAALLAVSSTEAYIKEWRPADTDWQNKDNWEGGALPCWRSRVVLPEEVVISVFLNGSVAWSELVMPQTGELVLEDLTLNAPETSQERYCSNQEIKFKNWRPSSWFDPDRWQIAESDGTIVPQPLAIPHSERIPCAHDSVHLLKRHSLSVDFNRINSLTVGQIKYGDQLLTAEEWRNQLNGPAWRYQVHNPPHSAYVNGTECQDVLGCRCGHDIDVMQMVCSNAGTLCSNQLECPDSFRPPGQCCDMCGSMMKVTFNERTFTKSSLDRLVTSMLAEDGWPDLQSYSYRTDENVLHLLVVDNTTNERSINVASKIHDYLMKDSREELSVGFARFQNDSAGNVEIAIDASFEQALARPPLDPDAPPRSSNHIQQEPKSPFTEAPEIPDTCSDSCHGSSNVKPAAAPAAWKKKFTRAFANPLFGDPSATVGRMSARWTMSSLMKNTVTQENPIYNMDVPESSTATSDITPAVVAVHEQPVDESPVVAITTLPATAVVSDRAEGEEGVAEGDVPPLVDTFQAVTDDDVSLPPAQGAFETVMEDVSLVEEPSCSAESLTVQPPPPPASSGSKNSLNGAKHPLKRLWKKATTKSSPAVALDPASALSSPQPSDAEPSEQPTRFTSPPQLLMSQQQRPAGAPRLYFSLAGLGGPRRCRQRATPGDFEKGALRVRRAVEPRASQCLVFIVTIEMGIK
ncbi:hypothetical protein DAPPUDRAFT_254308 [Daphnia pulex]|uniref:Protein amnionless n=1 Tax=Daphnia pulex TaxID=6669 RepID=E9H6S3_DAPPU|nr:hypothetical protein DAPPUDRAFT_254308 [Daphnia pulex]|eukprot:EFX72558.1 hypothetical protein DAPPUDRAFT_254308 [Daphnia pulex]